MVYLTPGDGYLPGEVSSSTTRTEFELTRTGGQSDEQPPKRIQIQLPEPAVDDGRYPAKRCVGDAVTVGADIFRDGHELLRAVVRYRGPGEEHWRDAEMRRIDAHLGGVRWADEITVERIGRWQYTIEAWTDVFGTWRDELERKLAGGQHDQLDDSS